MTQIVNATYEDGVFKPEQPPTIPVGAKVRLIVETASQSAVVQDALEELDRLCHDFPITSSEPHLTRDQLHERR